MSVVSKQVEARYTALQDPDLKAAAEIEEAYKEVYLQQLSIESDLKEKKREVAQLVSVAESHLNDRFITTFEAARLTGDSPQTVTRLTSRGFYTGAKIMGKWWVSVEDIKRKVNL